MKSNYLPIVVLLSWTLLASGARAQSHPGEATYKVQTVFIFNFTKYIRWPDEYNHGNFTIGVLGETNLTEELFKMAGTKTANGRKIVVNVYKELNDVDKQCHIVFICAERNDQLGALLQKTAGSSTLVITEKDGAARFGSQINFVSHLGQPRFEMNLSAFQKSRLQYDSKLKSVAIAL